MSGPSDWVIGEAVVVIGFVAWLLTRWKSGRRRRFRVTIVIEREYDGPDAEEGPPDPDVPPEA